MTRTKEREAEVIKEIRQAQPAYDYLMSKIERTIKEYNKYLRENENRRIKDKLRLEMAAFDFQTKIAKATTEKEIDEAVFNYNELKHYLKNSQEQAKLQKQRLEEKINLLKQFI